MILLICILALTLFSPNCHAGNPETGYGTSIAVEFRANNKFNLSVGILEYTGFSIDIVGFSGGLAGIGIIALPQVYLITEKTVSMKGFHHFKGKNQYGTEGTGYIDFRDFLKPKVTMLLDNGTLITNISPEGREWSRKHIPNIVLGM